MSVFDYSTICEEINGGDPISDTVLYVLINLAKAIVEQQRDWMRLRGTDQSLSVTVANNWETEIPLSGIANFSRFYGEYPIKIWDGAQKIEKLRQVPFEERILYKDDSSSFVYDAKNNKIYINGKRTFGGTLLISHISNSPTITEAVDWTFPQWAHPMLAFFAVSIHKGGIDYDDINARMAPENRAVAQALMARLVQEDAKLQEQEVAIYDPYETESEWRPGAINI